MHRRAFLLSFLIFFGAGGFLRADVLTLQNGSRLQGRVRVQKDGQYEVELSTSRFVIPPERVRSWEKKPLPEEEYALRRKAVRGDDIEALYLLGLWCRQNNLHDQAEESFRAILALNPDHNAARSALGYERVKGRWMTLAERKAAEGLVPHNGGWVTEAEAAAIEDRKRRKEAQREAAVKVWKGFRRVRRLRSEFAIEEEAEGFAELGEAAVDTLIQGTTEPSLAVRYASIRALGRIASERAAKALCKRMRLESNPVLSRAIADELAGFGNTRTVFQQLIHHLLDEDLRIRRERIIYAMGQTGERDLIPMLITWAAYSPNAGKQGVEDADDSAAAESGAGLDAEERERLSLSKGRYVVKEGKSLAEQMGSRKTEIIYPAAEALLALTGENLSPSVEAWKAWWQKAHTDFRLRTPDYPRRPPPAPVRHPLLSGGSLREEMLGR